MYLLVALLKELFLKLSFEWTSLKDAYSSARRTSQVLLKTRKHIIASEDQGVPLESSKCCFVAWVWDDPKLF